MANVKVRSGIVRNAVGVVLANKPAQLRNATTGVAIGAPVNTDANGRYTFSGLDETIRYQVEVAFGGGSSQLHVNSPISPDLDDAYINVSLRMAPAAIVNLPPLANIYLNSVLLTTALDARYVNVAGDAISGNLAIAGTLEVSGHTSLDEADISLLNVGSDANIPGTLTVDTIIGSGTGMLEIGTGGISTTGNLTIGGTAAVTNLLTANQRILVDGGSTPAPEVACITDPDTGIGWNGTNVLVLASGGNEVARSWMNGANSQFAIQADQAYIRNQIWIDTAMTTATSVANVVRKIEIRNAAGAAVGWVPVYSAAG